MIDIAEKHTDSAEPGEVHPLMRSWFARLDAVLRANVQARHRDEIREELRAHLDSRVDELLVQGADEEEATREAVREFGDVSKLARDFREARRGKQARRWRNSFFALLIGAGAIGVGAVALGEPAAEPVSVFAGGVDKADPVDPDAIRLASYEFGMIVDVLVSDYGHSPDLADALVLDFVRGLIEPGGWKEQGGDVAEAHAITGMVFVRGPVRVHERLEWACRRLNVQRRLEMWGKGGDGMDDAIEVGPVKE